MELSILPIAALVIAVTLLSIVGLRWRQVRAKERAEQASEGTSKPRKGLAESSKVAIFGSVLSAIVAIVGIFAGSERFSFSDGDEQPQYSAAEKSKIVALGTQLDDKSLRDSRGRALYSVLYLHYLHPCDITFTDYRSNWGEGWTEEKINIDFAKVLLVKRQAAQGYRGERGRGISILFDDIKHDGEFLITRENPATNERKTSPSVGSFLIRPFLEEAEFDEFFNTVRLFHKHCIKEQ